LFTRSALPRYLHSFPTRRSSDLADRVEQAGLAVVDVTHDGDHRRTDLQVRLVALVLAVGEVEALQQLTVLVLGADDLDDVVHLRSEEHTSELQSRENLVCRLLLE